MTVEVPDTVSGRIVPESLVRRAMQVIWPAFIAAAVAEALFFTIFDPFELHFFGAPLDWSRQAIYTLGFFGFWALGIGSSALTLLLRRSAQEVNRCPYPQEVRPPGCPGRTGAAGGCAAGASWDDGAQR